MGANWPTNLLRICIAIVAMLVGAVKSECQTLAPVDMSAFGKDRPLQAAFTQVTTSECKGAAYFKTVRLATTDCRTTFRFLRI